MKANLKLPARKGWFDPCGEWIGSGYDAEWNSALDEVSRLNQEQPSPAPELVEITQEHGHVVPRADGVKARCGGPAVCKVCQAEQDKTSTLMLLSMTREERDAARARVAELETDLADACASAQREELRANGYSHRLAELEKQEPVAWALQRKRDGFVRATWHQKPSETQYEIAELDGDVIAPLYAAPAAQAGQVPELDQLYSMLGAEDQVGAAKKIAELVGCQLSRSALTKAQMRRLYENSTDSENERLGFAAFARLMRRAEAVHQIAAAPAQGE